MATLHDLTRKISFLLYTYHNIGRLAQMVDTVVDMEHISKHHLSIIWQDEHWQIRDLSRNGTWLNNRKLEPYTLYAINEGDTISMADPSQATFTVVDTLPPCDLLIPEDNGILDINNTVVLSQYNLLPNQQTPKLALFLDNQQWYVESVDKEDSQTILLDDNAIIELEQQCWRLWRCREELQTKQLSGPQFGLAQLAFDFDLSLDEEETHLVVQTPDGKVNLAIRSHHYLVLNLARYRAADSLKGIGSNNQGWVSHHQVMKDLGIDYCHLNILVHRARKQFCDALNVCDAQSFIERHYGKLRFGGSRFKISKDLQVECEL